MTLYAWKFNDDPTAIIYTNTPTPDTSSKFYNKNGEEYTSSSGWLSVGNWGVYIGQGAISAVNGNEMTATFYYEK